MATSRQVIYDSRGLKIFANLFFPPASAPDRKNAAIVVGHQGTGVKEQASGLYATSLASEGFITLAFDAAYQGESEGLPRGLEDPAQRVEDIKSAVTYLSTLGNDVVDPSRIGCAVAGVSTMCFGTLTREGMKDPATGQIDAVKLSQGLEQAAQARVDEMEGKASVTHNILDVFSHPREDIRAYYNDPRWSNPRCTNEMVTRSMELLVTFDSFQYIEWISPRPLLLVAGNEAMAFPYSQQISQRAKEPKELFVIDGAGHVQLYQDVSRSGPKLVNFFARALCIDDQLPHVA
ncbi:unnamed protein product [Colletotrichum noveboracense]|uniref:Dienelactone hydrolase domain-containing protein n=1 Tax=Colletotrichum noveboracense TaxID=2664923 RepID=A0A9W4S3D9_9PEZI|nr:unnamed protein product [Colletotrichum noveboracense]